MVVELGIAEGDVVRNDVGVLDGCPVGDLVGEPVGTLVGALVGESVGALVGDWVGDRVGSREDVVSQFTKHALSARYAFQFS